MINVNSLNDHCQFLPARLATLPYGLDSNVTQLLANLLTKPSVFYYLPIIPCNLVSIKLLLYIIIIIIIHEQSIGKNSMYVYTNYKFCKRETNPDDVIEGRLSKKKIMGSGGYYGSCMCYEQFKLRVMNNSNLEL